MEPRLSHVRQSKERVLFIRSDNRNYSLGGCTLMKRFFTLSLSILTCIAVSSAFAEWPNYLGPDRNAHSDETGLLREWPEDGPEVLWSKPLGPGFGSAAIVDGKVFLLNRVEESGDQLLCLDLETGEEVWSAGYDSPGKVGYHGSRCTPTVTDDSVFTIGPMGDVVCFDRKAQDIKWQRKIRDGFGEGSQLNWGFGQNPLLYDGKLFVAPMTEETTLIALNPETGDLVWKSEPLPGRAGYVSPGVVQVGGEDHIYMITAHDPGRNRRIDPAELPAEKRGAISGFDPDSGEVLWTYTWDCLIPIPGLVQIEDGRFFITGGYEAGSAMFTVAKDGEDYKTETVFDIDHYTAHCHPPVLYKGHLYGLGTTNETRDGMVCLDLEGNVLWKTGRDPIFNKGGFILVDDMIIAADGQEGFVYLVDPSPEGFKPLAKAKLLGENEAWGPLAIDGDKLVIRDQEQMRCVKVK